ncbi:MAG: hypothetical protein HLUCCA11_19840 [Phormidesmis priestleyi Ana]|uniref:Uncharacterized protein n=1 Tax=Phormidesmis priestleyi Ana TaxID=1666911 RepID=A0A0P8DAA5_9CYAN|nr:MAG: hypothetical protein HLUCCA11_19840 [Phormidesmis priestleyi Ana]
MQYALVCQYLGVALTVMKMPRYSLDLSEEDKQRIETCRTDLSWQELSFGAKLKVLILEKLQQYEKERDEKSDKA